MLDLSIAKADYISAVKAVELDLLPKIRLVGEATGFESIAYLKSFTSERRPPVHAHEAERFAHPGHWSDVQSQLVNSYGFKVTDVPGGIRLTLSNTAEYAIYLELKHGFFVLSGIMDQNGILATTLVKALGEIVPEMQVNIGQLNFGHASEVA